jgi:transcriptional regulator with XRE-family HTH domain
MNLRSLRESLGKTQDEIARRAAMTQSQLSRLERRDDHLLSTLRKYVRALGGDLEVVAVLRKKRVSLRDV